MSGNTIGKIFSLTTFGESHGQAIGGVIDGCPANLRIDHEFIREEMKRRQTGHGFWSSQRKEEDEVEFLSGLFEGVTTGTPLAFLIRNKDHRPSDYSGIKDIFRPSHADFTYHKKYGIRDYRGGGRSSARETISRVVAGAVAKMFLSTKGIEVFGLVSQIGPVKMELEGNDFSVPEIESSPVRCPDKKASEEMLELLKETKHAKDSVGGVVTCIVKGVPAGLGEPVFDKLNADIAKAIISINAVKGIEFGTGFKSVAMKGSEHNDPFVEKNGEIRTSSNHSGGIQGGISNGMDICFHTAFKPASTIALDQSTVDKKGEAVNIQPGGRHDVCIVPRAVPIVEAMTAIILTDHLLRYKAYQ